MRLLYRSSPPPASAQSPSPIKSPDSIDSTTAASSNSSSEAPSQSTAGFDVNSQPPSPQASVSSRLTYRGRAANASTLSRSPSQVTAQSAVQTAALGASPVLMPRASYAAMHAAWLGADSPLPQMSLTRLLVMFFLERSVAGLSSAWQQLICIGALLLPLSSTTSLSVMTIAPHVAVPDTWLVQRQQKALPAGISLQHDEKLMEEQAPDASKQQASEISQDVSRQGGQESPNRKEVTHAGQVRGKHSWAHMTTVASQSAPVLRSALSTALQHSPQSQPEAWEEAASMVQVSLALGLQVGSPERHHLARQRLSEQELAEKDGGLALATSSMSSMSSSLGQQSASLSRSSSLSEASGAEDSSDAASDAGAQSREHLADMSLPASAQSATSLISSSSSSSSKMSLRSGGLTFRQQSSDSLVVKADEASTRLGSLEDVSEGCLLFEPDAQDLAALEGPNTKAAVPASSLEAWPGKGYFAIGKTLYLMPRAAESHPDLSSVPDASPSNASSGVIRPCHLMLSRPCQTGAHSSLLKMHKHGVILLHIWLRMSVESQDLMCMRPNLHRINRILIHPAVACLALPAFLVDVLWCLASFQIMQTAAPPCKKDC